MAYGLADVVNQRRMIDESPAGEEFKRVQRGKLDALLALAEAHDCRRARLLAYFGETYAGRPRLAADEGDAGLPAAEPRRPEGTSWGVYCGNCDNCLTPPATWDATEAARMALSGIYRFWQHGQQRYGAGHLIDVLRGKVTDKVTQNGHERLSTFGVGQAVSEARWRAVLRQLVALGHVVAEGEYGTLALTDSARAVLKGEVTLRLREPSEAPRGRKAASARGGRSDKPAPIPLDAEGQVRFAALKAWRAEVAKAHNLPAYVVFHDATLAEMARAHPGSLEALGQISGVGAKKLEAYGGEILRVLGGA
jgi:ATP-dependent DNA helicase RecQ